MTGWLVKPFPDNGKRYLTTKQARQGLWLKTHLVNSMTAVLREQSPWCSPAVYFMTPVRAMRRSTDMNGVYLSFFLQPDVPLPPGAETEGVGVYAVLMYFLTN